MTVRFIPKFSSSNGIHTGDEGRSHSPNGKTSVTPSGESRREWILPLFQQAGLANSNNRGWQLWQQDNHPIALYTEKVAWQKLRYLHQNPVVARFVDRAADWVWSSARDYCGLEGAVKGLLLLEPAVGFEGCCISGNGVSFRWRKHAIPVLYPSAQVRHAAMAKLHTCASGGRCFTFTTKSSSVTHRYTKAEKEQEPLLDKDHYPECYLPEKLVRIFNGDTELLFEESKPPFTKKSPKEPEKPDAPQSYVASAILLFFLMILFLAFGLFKYPELFFSLFTILAILGMIAYIRERGSYKEAMIDYEEKREAYEDELTDYNSYLGTYNIKIEELKTRLLEDEYAQRCAREISKKVLADASDNLARKKSPIEGRSEKFFLSYLRKYFGDAIKTNHAIRPYYLDDDYGAFEEASSDAEIPEDVMCYVPDYCFVHPRNGIHIDIEIDEPYSYGEPIHFIGSDNDRNKFFTERNWIVLRFSEQQVLQQPDQCCREIAEIIDYFSGPGGNSYSFKLRGYSRVGRHVKWTDKEAEVFAQKGLRRNYPQLPKYSVDLQQIHGTWASEKFSLEFSFTRVTKSVVQDIKIRRTAQSGRPQRQFLTNTRKEHQKTGAKGGAFHVRENGYRGYILTIFWDSGVTNIYTIDNLTKEELIMTNFNTRDVHFFRNISRGIEHLPALGSNTNRIDLLLSEVEEFLQFEGLIAQLSALNKRTDVGRNLMCINKENFIVVKMNTKYFLELVGLPIEKREVCWSVNKKHMLNETAYLEIELFDPTELLL